MGILSSLLVLLPILRQEDPLERTARAVADLVAPDPRGFEPLFHETFLAQVPPARLAAILRDLHRQHGKVAAVSLQARESETSGVFAFACEKGARLRVTLTLAAGDPPRIIGLWFAPSGGAHRSMAEVVEEMRKLPGTVGFRLARLGEELEPLYDLNPDRPLAIGSTFKLYVLAALVEDRRPWDEIVRLREDLRSLPSGELHAWPEGAPLTVHTLAALMIARSDNTAADHLLHHAGRRRIEDLLEPLGNAHAPRSRPFLSTLELFKLKSDADLRGRYLEAGEAGRRALLEGPVRQMPRRKVAVSAVPIAVDRLEWFASAADLCRLMDWFRRKGDPVALEILGIHRGLDVPPNRFPRAGFKGGSEPGVLNLTWLLGTPAGAWYALSAGWNDPEKPLDERRFLDLVQSAIHLAGR